MKFSALLAFSLFALGAQASWFGSDTPTYQTWDTKQLTAWLKEHNVQVPKGTTSQKDLQELVKSNWASTQAFTADQYAGAQKAFQNLKDSAFDTWDESTLRSFLVEQGVVNPSGPREQLVLLAKQRYKDYQSAASSLSYQASTGVYGSPAYQATQSISSAIAAATNTVGRQLDDSKDYVYSSWDDNRLRTYLEEKGVLKTKQEATRDEMLKMMKDSYAKVANPAWDAWSDSYLNEWLYEHRVYPHNDVPPPRPTLAERMKNYYYDTTSHVWDSWTDSELKAWLVEHNIIKSDAQIKREKLQKLVGDNYSHAEDVAWASWRDSDIRAWLVSNGYLSDDEASKMSREHLVKLINTKYKDTNAKASSYLVWPDARLRAYLREHGVSEDALPTTRPGLLQEVRIRYVQATTRTDEFIQRIRESLNSGIHIAEDKLAQVVDLLSGSTERAKERAADNVDWATSKGVKGTASVKSAAAEASVKAKYDL